ncbi:MAG: hypothetical protein ACD_28C00048G0002 [uncultured bacterium]|nr:MAG: hypothetical protein ACD_28C00048G0002 [uncultured bacterium]KKT76922.1 MAG: Type 4 prepilin-like protein leader peptide-processing enzyme [Candidatus Peregrinibacteria bacterium GW2011_GWA2_44_7]
MPPFPTPLLFVAGLLLGSFLSVLIPRLHKNERGIFAGRSQCTHCKTTLKATDLIPLVSYVLYKGKCRYCKESIGWTYPALELSTAFLFLGLGFSGLTPLPLYLFYGLVLIFIFFYDLRYLEIPDEVMLPSIFVAILANLTPYGIPFLDGLYGALIMMSLFLIQIVLSRGRWLGGGDLRIGAFMGFILGWELTLVALLMSYLIGATISLILLALGKVTRKTMVPFGPFLVLGTLIALFWGPQLIEWYLNFIQL